MNTSEPVANRDAYLTMLNEKEEKAAQNREPAKAQELDPNQKADQYSYVGTSDKATIRKDSSGNIQIEYNASTAA